MAENTAPPTEQELFERAWKAFEEKLQNAYEYTQEEMKACLKAALSTQPSRPQGEAGQTDLDRAWRAVDACGGAHTREDRESGYARGYDEALTFACAEIEKLGGRRS